MKVNEIAFCRKDRKTVQFLFQIKTQLDNFDENVGVITTFDQIKVKRHFLKHFFPK